MYSMRSTLARGLGASGFQKGLIERYKLKHFDMRHAKSLLLGAMARKEPFVSFFSLTYQGRVPSPAFSIRCVTEDIELRIPYYTLKQAMIDGTSGSGDRSMKITKVTLVDGNRSYDAFYSLMNPHVQRGAWFTNGIWLEEVEPTVVVR
jgi:hypothetical protein